MNHTRDRYNAKARQSTAGPSKKNGKRRPVEEDDERDPNAAIYIPKTKEEKGKERMERFRQEVCIRVNSFAILDRQDYCSSLPSRIQK